MDFTKYFFLKYIKIINNQIILLYLSFFDLIWFETTVEGSVFLVNLMEIIQNVVYKFCTKFSSYLM